MMARLQWVIDKTGHQRTNNVLSHEGVIGNNANSFMALRVGCKSDSTKSNDSFQDNGWVALMATCITYIMFIRPHMAPTMVVLI